MAELDSLEALDPAFVHLFVVGPGQGEALAIALPSRGWLLVDGCRADRRTGGELPVAKILERWRRGLDDPILAMVLSHPHKDHAHGFVELLEQLGPRMVVIAGAGSMGAEDRHHLSAQRAAWSWSERVTSTRVRDALAAIRQWGIENPGGLISAFDGVSLPLEHATVQASIRAPDRSGIEAVLGVGFSPARANEASTVLELRFGESAILLGGDLPWKRGGAELSHGWSAVLSRHPHLAGHHLLKVPHHGSMEALHPGLMAPSGHERFWCVTPYNTSRIPGAGPRDGLQRLLDNEPAVHLTALSAQTCFQRCWPPPARVPIDQLQERTDAARTGNGFIDGAVDLRPASVLEPLDPLWCCAIDDRGKIAGRWRGRAAMEITR